MFNSSDIAKDRVSGLIGRLLAPVAIVVLIALAAVLSLIWVAARGQDEVAKQDSANLMRAVTEGIERDLGQLVYDYSW
ncbi:MAG: hypothetical protein QMB76_00415 [Alphaproteobacteria bacterium]